MIKKIMLDIINYEKENKSSESEKIKKLEEKLVYLYHFYFMPLKKDDYNFKINAPKFNVNNTRENICKNFPSFGYYNDVLEMITNIGEPIFSVGDVVDDLVDIIVGLKKILWYFDNDCQERAIYEFKLLFDNHLKDHLINLLRFINEYDN